MTEKSHDRKQAMDANGKRFCKTTVLNSAKKKTNRSFSDFVQLYLFTYVFMFPVLIYPKIFRNEIGLEMFLETHFQTEQIEYLKKSN